MNFLCVRINFTAFCVFEGNYLATKSSTPRLRWGLVGLIAKGIALVLRREGFSRFFLTPLSSLRKSKFAVFYTCQVIIIGAVIMKKKLSSFPLFRINWITS